jgi:hypothetical protein
MKIISVTKTAWAASSGRQWYIFCVRKHLKFLWTIFILEKVNYPCNRLWRPIGLWDVEAPTDGGDVSLTRRPPSFCESPLHYILNAWTDLYATCRATWAISTASSVNPSYNSVCFYVYPLTVARKRLSKNIPAPTNCWRLRFLYGLYCIKESRWVCVSPYRC